MIKKIFVFSLVTASIFSFPVLDAQGQGLNGIETYEAPAYPEHGGIEKETYDYRVESGESVPPTFTDALICDLWQRITKDLGLATLDTTSVTEITIASALNVYVTKDWMSIAGYRPWTHWNYIRSLSTYERKTLAKEAAAYMKERGVVCK